MSHHHHHHPHHGAAAAGAFACAVCGSHEATPNQDDELVCDICGTLSQLTVAESHGFDEAVSGGHMARAGRGNIVRAGLGVGRAAAAAAGGGGAEGDTKGAPGARAKGPPTSASALREATKACLLAYQTILRALGEALVGLMDGPRGPLLQALEELWFLYLDAWRARGRYPIGYCFLGGTGGTGRFLKEYEALPEVQTLRTREGRKTRGVPAATAAALARLGVALPGTDGDGGGSTASDDDDDGEPEEDAMNMDMDEVDEQGQGQEGRKRKRGQQGRSTRAGRGEVELASDAFLTMPMLLAFLDLAAQQLRLGQVLPHRLTRWCEEGSLPYLQAWLLLPAELRTQLSQLDGPSFFFRTTARRLPTPGDTYRNSARLVAALRLDRPPPNVPLMAQALLHDLGLLAPPTKPKPTAAPFAFSASSSSSSTDNNNQPTDAQGEAVLECCLRFWARAQREAAAPPDGPGGNKRRKRQRWWASLVAEIGDDPAVLFAVVLMALRLASPTPFPPPTGPDQRDRAGADVLGWEGWGWEAPSAGNGSSMAIPNTLEGLCALPAAALREGGGGYAGWYRRVVLGMPPPTTAATPSAPSQDEAEEQEERAAALAGGLWGAEHGRTLQTLAGSGGGASSASTACASSSSPLLTATLKLPPTQPARPDRPTRPARGIKPEDGQSVAAPVAAALAPAMVVPIERERSALAQTLAPQRVVETPESVAGKVPYTVYAGADETGLVHDHLWALIERGAALLQVPPAYLLRHVLSLDQHLFPPRPPPLQRPLGSRHTNWWDGDVHELLLQAQRQGRAELAAPEEKGAGRGGTLRQQREEDGSSGSGSEIRSSDDDDDNGGGGGTGRMPRRRGVKVGPRPPAIIEGREVL